MCWLNLTNNPAWVGIFKSANSPKCQTPETWFDKTLIFSSNFKAKIRAPCFRTKQGALCFCSIFCSGCQNMDPKCTLIRKCFFTECQTTGRAHEAGVSHTPAGRCGPGARPCGVGSGQAPSPPPRRIPHRTV